MMHILRASLFLLCSLLYFEYPSSAFRTTRRYITKDVSPYRLPFFALNQKGDGDDDDSGIKRKRTKFDRLVDDFVGKKFGAGEAFYGKRTSTMSDDEYNAMMLAQRRERDKASSTGAVTTEEDWNTMSLKPNAILIVGDPYCEALQGVVFELVEKDFNVRIVCSDIRGSLDAFGSPGFNVDLVQLSPTSGEARYARALDGVQAMVLFPGFVPSHTPFDKRDEALLSEFLVSKKLIEKAVQGNNELAKVIYLSRFFDESKGMQYQPVKSMLERFDVVSLFADYLTNVLVSRDELSIQSSRFQPFRLKHRDFENIIRKSGLEHTIIRVPPTLDSLPGAREEVALEVLAPSTSDAAVAAIQPIAMSPTNAISLYDLAEVTTQCLISEDTADVTLTVSRASAPSGLFPQRCPRRAYYAILEYDAALDLALDGRLTNGTVLTTNAEKEAAVDTAFRAARLAYAYRSAAERQIQLEEDELVEKYWTSVLSQVIRAGMGR